MTDDQRWVESSQHWSVDVCVQLWDREGGSQPDVSDQWDIRSIKRTENTWKLIIRNAVWDECCTKGYGRMWWLGLKISGQGHAYRTFGATVKSKLFTRKVKNRAQANRFPEMRVFDRRQCLNSSWQDPVVTTGLRDFARDGYLFTSLRLTGPNSFQLLFSFWRGIHVMKGAWRIVDYFQFCWKYLGAGSILICSGAQRRSRARSNCAPGDSWFDGSIHSIQGVESISAKSHLSVAVLLARHCSAMSYPHSCFCQWPVQYVVSFG